MCFERFRRFSLVPGTLLLVATLAVADGLTPTPVNSAPPELSSARATMETFLNAFYATDGADLKEAARCMDLSEIPAGLREAMSGDFALQLKDVLDRTELIDVSKISGDPNGPPWVLRVGEAAKLVISRVEDGRWLFSRETINELGGLRDIAEERGVVQGVEKPVEEKTVSGWLRSMAPETLRHRRLILEGWQWIGMAALLLLGFVVNRILLLFLAGPALKLLRIKFGEIREEKVRYVLRPLGLLAMLILWWFGLIWLGLPVSVLRWYAAFVGVALIVVACLSAYRLVDVLCGVLSRRAAETENRFDDLLVPLIRKSLKILIVVIGIVLVSQAFDQDLTGLLAGLGIGGLALALAAQDTIGNLFGSLTVLLDRPFQVGDWIKVEDVEGTVEEVGFRSTRVRTFYNSLISLPNSHLTSAAVDNLGLRQYRRWSTRLGLAYDTTPESIDAFCEGVRELIRQHPQTWKGSFHVYFNEFGASSLEVMLYVFFQTPDWAEELKARHRLAVDIVRMARELGVEFAFPTQTLYLRKEEWSRESWMPQEYREGAGKLEEKARKIAQEISDPTKD